MAIYNSQGALTLKGAMQAWAAAVDSFAQEGYRIVLGEQLDVGRFAQLYANVEAARRCCERFGP